MTTDVIKLNFQFKIQSITRKCVQKTHDLPTTACSTPVHNTERVIGLNKSAALKWKISDEKDTPEMIRPGSQAGLATPAKLLSETVQAVLTPK